MADATHAWTVARLLVATQKFLTERGIDGARLDAELLLCQVLKRDRVYLYTHYDQPVSDAERDGLRDLVKQRGAHAPIAYLRGEQEFYGLAFEVNADVLIPRPETEHVVEAALAWLAASKLPRAKVADVGCGSGAIAVAIAKNDPSVEVWATDVDGAALAVAARNVAKHGLANRVHLVHADLLEPRGAALPDSFDVIVSNPPYVADGACLPRTVAGYEPHGALFAGADGLDVVRRLLPQVRVRLATPGFFALEYAPEQTQALAALLATGFAGHATVRDLAGHDRVAIAWRGPDHGVANAGFLAASPAAGPLPTDTAAEAAQPEVPHVQLDEPEWARD